MRAKDEGTGVLLPKLRSVRDGALMTQKELAETAGVSRATIVAAENGERVSKANARKLAQALGVPGQVLLGTTPAPALMPESALGAGRVQ